MSAEQAAAKALLPPWLHAAHDSVVDMAATGRLPHALLIACPLGWCESALVSVLACHILGLEAQADVRELAHHDLNWVEREDGKAGYSVEQIRTLIDFMHRTARGNGNKLVVLPDAHRMREESANTLLKILEEPPPGGHWLLLTHEPARLLPTIRSRCQRVTVTPAPDLDTRAHISDLVAQRATAEEAAPTPTDAELAMLQVEFMGAPELVAGALLAGEEPIWPFLAGVIADRGHITAVAERWTERELTDLMAAWQRYVHALVADQLPAYAELSPALVQPDRTRLFSFADELADARSTVMYNPGVNKRLLLERLLLRWASAVAQ